MQETWRHRFNLLVEKISWSGGGHSNPLQYPGLNNLMDRGAWLETVHRVAKSQTQLKDWAQTHIHTHTHTHTHTMQTRVDTFKFVSLQQISEKYLVLKLLDDISFKQKHHVHHFTYLLLFFCGWKGHNCFVINSDTYIFWKNFYKICSTSP